MSQLKVTLKRGSAGKSKRQKLNLESLGLRKPNQTVVLQDNPSIRGLIDKVFHLVEVEEVKG